MTKEKREEIIKAGMQNGLHREEAERYLDAAIKVELAHAGRAKIIEMVSEAAKKGEL